MKFQLLIVCLILLMNPQLIYDFSKDSNLSTWLVINDGVMGGVSQSSLELDADGNGLFSGAVSLDNNGGFCSVRYNFESLDVSNFKSIVLHVRGDGKRYQFRIRHNSRDYYSYITYFETNGDWQTVELELADMYPSFRGRKVDLPNFNKDYIEEIALLIGNKKEEKFMIEIDKISLK